MLQEFIARNENDEDGNPSGGHVSATGLEIDWQNGPLERSLDRAPANGVFVETVITAALQRLEYYQSTKFSCRENAIAIMKLEEALHWLESRTKNRETRQV